MRVYFVDNSTEKLALVIAVEVYFNANNNEAWLLTQSGKNIAFKISERDYCRTLEESKKSGVLDWRYWPSHWN